MFSEEKVIDGVLCVRYGREDEFKPYTLMELTNMFVMMRRKLASIEYIVRELNTTIKEAGK